MRRDAVIALITLFGVVGFTGCASANGAERVDSATASPSVSAADSVPGPSPDAPEPDPGDPSAWLIDQNGIGPYELGMPFDAALAIEPGFDHACHEYAYNRQLGDDPSAEIWITNSDGVLDYVQSSSPDGPHTAGGIGVGSTTADVLEAYPGAVVVLRNLTYLRVGDMFFGYISDVAYEEDETSYRDDDGVPEEIVAVGVTTDDILWEFCG